MNKEIREPQQERSAEKKSKIIEASYELFSEIGYYSATTPEIAKRAGVSTGIVYSYFKDKRDILAYVLKIYIDKVSEPVMDVIKSAKAPVDLNKLAAKVVDKTIKLHKENSHLHNTLHALAATDAGVNEQFMLLEYKITKAAAGHIADLGIDIPDGNERVHFAMNIIQSFAHEYVYDKHKYINYQSMKKIVCAAIVALFE